MLGLKTPHKNSNNQNTTIFETKNKGIPEFFNMRHFLLLQEVQLPPVLQEASILVLQLANVAQQGGSGLF